MLENVLFFN